MRPRYAPILLSSLALSAALLFAPHRALGQSGGVLLQVDSQYEQSRDPRRVGGLRDVASAGLAVDAYGGSDHAGLAAYVDAHFGGGLQGGFAYRVALLPFGVAIYDGGQVIGLAIASGLQLQGVTDHQRLGVQVPVRASLRLRLGDHLHLDLYHANEISLGRGRDDGAQNALFGDELRTGLSLRIGKGGTRDEGQHSVVYGSGYFIGVSYAERLKTEYWGLAIGHGMDMHGG